jgi:hypothetical protein
MGTEAIVAAPADSGESFAALPQWLEVLNSSQMAPIRAMLAINNSDPKDALCPEVSGWVESHTAPLAMSFFVLALTGDGVKLAFENVARIADASRMGTHNGRPQPERVGERQGESS